MNYKIFNCSKNVISLVIWDLSAFASWYSIFIKRHHIKSLYKAFKNIEKSHLENISQYCFHHMHCTCIYTVLFYPIWLYIYSENSKETYL